MQKLETGLHWIVEEYSSTNQQSIVKSFKTYEEAYAFYTERYKESSSNISIYRIHRQLLLES